MKNCGKYILVSLFVLMVQGTVAQIIGQIVDNETKKPIPDVHVHCSNTSIGTITNGNGTFKLRVATEQTSLIVSAVGYATVETEVSGSTDSITIELSPTSKILDQGVIVTAQRQENSPFEVPQAITMLTQQQLLQNSPRTIPEALMNQSGIWVQKTNHGGGSPIIRGLVGNQVLLLIDGIRLNNATYRYGPNQYLNTIDPWVVSKIEAIRGSGSVLYGSDALGGVVQVLSKTPSFSSDQPSISAHLFGKWMNNEMESSGRAELEVGAKKIAFLGGFSERHFGALKAGGNFGTLIPTGYSERSGDAKLLFRVGEGVVTAAFQQTTQFEVPRYDQVTQGGYDVYNFNPQTRQLSYLRWESSTLNPWLQSIRITGLYGHTSEGIDAQKTNSLTIKKQLDEVIIAGFTTEIISNPLQNWTAQSGIEFYHDYVSSEAREIDTSTQAETMVRGSFADGSTNSNLALYTNHQVAWKKFIFSSGMRGNLVTVTVQDVTFGNQAINPAAVVGNLGLVYEPLPGMRALIMGNTGFRAPNIDDMSKFGAVEATVFEIPSAELAPEHTRSLEMGLKFQRKKFTGSISGYQTWLRDLIDRVPAAYKGSSVYEGRNVYQKQNVGEAIIKGVEAEGEVSLWKLISLYGHATYTYGQNITKQEPMRRIPPLFGKVGVQYRSRMNWWVKGELAVAGNHDRLAAGDKSDVRISSRLENGVMPGWNSFNLYAGYRYRWLNLQTSFINVFDQGYRVYASGVDEYGRCLNVSIILHFNN